MNISHYLPRTLTAPPAVLSTLASVGSGLPSSQLN